MQLNLLQLEIIYQRQRRISFVSVSYQFGVIVVSRSFYVAVGVI